MEEREGCSHVMCATLFYILLVPVYEATAERRVVPLLVILLVVLMPGAYSDYDPLCTSISVYNRKLQKKIKINNIKSNGQGYVELNKVVVE